MGGVETPERVGELQEDFYLGGTICSKYTSDDAMFSPGYSDDDTVLILVMDLMSFGCFHLERYIDRVVQSRKKLK